MLLKKSFVIHLCCLKKKYSVRENNKFPETAIQSVYFTAPSDWTDQKRENGIRQLVTSAREWVNFLRHAYDIIPDFSQCFTCACHFGAFKCNHFLMTCQVYRPVTFQSPCFESSLRWGRIKVGSWVKDWHFRSQYPSQCIRYVIVEKESGETKTQSAGAIEYTD